MNDRFKFRATFSLSYYDEKGNDKDIKLTIYDVAVYSGGEIGFSAQQIETIINALKLSEIEEDTIWQFINDNYATSSYEWFVCDNATIEQCTGLKDKNGNLIYEGDIVKIPDDYETYGFMSGEKREVYFRDGGFRLKPKDTKLGRGHWLEQTSALEIIGNVHDTAEQKNK